MWYLPKQLAAPTKPTTATLDNLRGSTDVTAAVNHIGLNADTSWLCDV